MEKIEVTSLGDSTRKFLPVDLCDKCLNDGEGAKKCKLNKDGKCNYIPKNKNSGVFPPFFLRIYLY